MKKLKLLIALSLAANNAFAVDSNGTSVNWSSQFSDMATFNCSGTVIAAKYLLTAAHCQNENSSITFSDGSVKSGVVNNHPSWGGVSGANYDVSLWTLPGRHETSHVRYFADLNSDTVSDGDSLKIYGFAGTNNLSFATVTIDTRINALDPTGLFYGSFDTGNGTTLGGDSGGVWLDNSGKIVGTHTSALNTDRVTGSYRVEMYAANLHSSKDFILDTVNGWHYPPLATTSGDTVTITVQSLHKNVVSDSAYTDGSATITGGTCQGNAAINSFETCTYTVQSSGEGKLYLTASEYVHINKPALNIGDASGSGGGGGSMGLGTLLLLGGAFVRRKTK